ncbi:hypothetical protein [Pseudogemmobacter bohemicus]|uniref:hypothetical protein n=1 Tax=Pseudogemmobacter bohemicus TaxID=2250708 RepID=UPI000DD3F80F|nr:hypothetical protein [Pseudogemmobacter bohemicus]
MKTLEYPGFPARYLIAFTLALLPIGANASGIGLDHDGNGREIIVDSHASGSQIVSRGNGGSLDSILSHSDDISTWHLGGESDAIVDVYDSVGTDIFIGHCPPGMNPEPIEVNDDYGGLIIPRCY